jgi:SP family sugar:H+ symporter-like MFS transporter
MRTSLKSVTARLLLLLSSVLQSCSLMTMGILGTVQDQSVMIKQGIVGMLLVYSFAWSVGWAPLTYVIGAELPSAPLREVTLQIAYTLKLITECVIAISAIAVRV